MDIVSKTSYLVDGSTDLATRDARVGLVVVMLSMLVMLSGRQLKMRRSRTAPGREPPEVEKEAIGDFKKCLLAAKKTLVNSRESSKGFPLLGLRPSTVIVALHARTPS